MKIKDVLAWRKRFIVLLLATTIPLTNFSCFNKKIKNEKEMAIDLNVSKKEFQEYVDYFFSVNTLYNWEEYYITNEEVENLIKISRTNANCDFVYDQDLKKLIETIRVNSLDYLKKNSEYCSAFCNDGSQNEYQLNFEASLSYCLKFIINNATNDINEDICRMQSLKIVFGSVEEGTLAYYNVSDNLLVLSPDAIYNSSVKMKNTFFEEINLVLVHELEHLRQHICSCRQDYGQLNNNINYSNSTCGLIEASAESFVYNFNFDPDVFKKRSSDYSYYLLRRNEGLLLLLGLFHDDLQIDDYYNAINDSNLCDFYKFFGAKTEEEIYQLYKIIYAMDGYGGRNDLIKDIFKGEKDISYDELEKEIGGAYRVDIFKIVLANMVNYTLNNKDITLEENLTMFNIVKNLIVESTFGSKEPIHEHNYANVYEPDIAYDVYRLALKYTDFLTEYYGVSKEYVDNIEKNYIVGVISDINWIIMRDGKPTDSYSDMAYDIIEKYPLLRAILFPSSCFSTDYNEFVDRNMGVISKKLQR